MNQMLSPSIWKSTGVAPVGLATVAARICQRVMTPSLSFAMLSAYDSRNQTVPSGSTRIRTPLTRAAFWVWMRAPSGVGSWVVWARTRAPGPSRQASHPQTTRAR